MANAIVVLGGLNYDFVLQADRLPRPGETVEGNRFYTSGGGKGANQTVAAARLADPGTPVRLIGRVGDDAEGRALLALLEGDGVDCAGVATDPAARSGVAMIVLDAEGENTVLAVYGANAGCGEAELAALERALPGTGVLLVQQEIPLSVTAAAMRMARAQGVRVILDPAPVRPELPKGFHALANILTPNQGEAEALIRGPDGGPASGAPEAAVALRDRGIANVIVTLAADRGGPRRRGRGAGHDRARSPRAAGRQRGRGRRVQRGAGGRAERGPPDRGGGRLRQRGGGAGRDPARRPGSDAAAGRCRAADAWSLTRHAERQEWSPAHGCGQEA